MVNQLKITLINSDEFSQLDKTKFKTYSKLILALYENENSNPQDEGEEKYTCISCFAKFNNKYKLAAHYRTNKDCGIIYLLEQNTPKPCPNPNCNTWWINEKELNKHIKYHCRLSNEETILPNTRN